MRTQSKRFSNRLAASRDKAINSAMQSNESNLAMRRMITELFFRLVGKCKYLWFNGSTPKTHESKLEKKINSCPKVEQCGVLVPGDSRGELAPPFL